MQISDCAGENAELIDCRKKANNLSVDRNESKRSTGPRINSWKNESKQRISKNKSKRYTGPEQTCSGSPRGDGWRKPLAPAGISRGIFLLHKTILVFVSVVICFVVCLRVYAFGESRIGIASCRLALHKHKYRVNQKEQSVRRNNSRRKETEKNKKNTIRCAETISKNMKAKIKQSSAKPKQIDKR
jgi:hypothetical protein